MGITPCSNYDAASETFTPGTLADKPPQGNNAMCGFGCHTRVKTRDYVFTDYGLKVKRYEQHSDVIPRLANARKPEKTGAK